MPPSHGIHVSLVIGPNWEDLYEYTIPGVEQALHCVPTDQEEPKAPDGASKSSVSSVYVASLPGSRFAIRYATVKGSTPACKLYFKAFINGRNVANWGVGHSEEGATGLIQRALYEPSDRWRHTNAKVVYKPQGIEARAFEFLDQHEETSIATEGGLIEVKVFRSKGRLPRAACLQPYRSQEGYGIRSPSLGMLDCPEDMRYYDWILRDPIDQPYAWFQFHYRSTANLRSLDFMAESPLEQDRSGTKVIEQCLSRVYPAPRPLPERPHVPTHALPTPDAADISPKECQYSTASSVRGPFFSNRQTRSTTPERPHQDPPNCRINWPDRTKEDVLEEFGDNYQQRTPQSSDTESVEDSSIF